MKRCFMIFLIIPVLLNILASCTNITVFRIEPDEVNKTLLIGQVKIEISNHQGMINIDGVHTNKVQIHFKNMETNKITKIKSLGKDGWFYWVNPEAQKYKILKIVVKIGDHYKWQSLSFSVNRNILIEHGKVNNLGFFHIKSDCNIEKYSYKLNFMYKYIKNWFINRYPESLWNNLEWVDIESMEKWPEYTVLLGGSA